MAEVVSSLAVAVLFKLASYPAGKIQSTWLAKEHLVELQRYLDTLCPFIEDAEKRQSNGKLIKKWVRDLKDVCYDIDDLLDEADAEVMELEAAAAAEGESSSTREKVRNYLSYAKKKFVSKTIVPFSLSTKIRKILDRLEEIDASTSNLKLVAANLARTVPLPQSTTNYFITYPLPFVNQSENIKGRDKAKSEILNRVLGNNIECSFGLSVLPIVGIGGLGKTTLAQLVYSDPAIGENFDTKLWACVSNPFKLELVLERLLNEKGLGLGKMVGMLGNKVRDKKYFMVLDDIWTRNKREWDTLRDILVGGGAGGSVILVTTRDKEVATRTIGVKNYYDLEKLSFDLCMSMFIENAFGTQEEYGKHPYLARAVEHIVKKCGGVPLAAKTLGSSLRGERDEGKWRRVVESDLWKIESKEGGILAALKLSYNALDSQLKLCFAYLSVFPKDCNLKVDDVISMWIAQGLIDQDNPSDELEEKGYKYLEELLSRSLLHEPFFFTSERVYKCKMHDFVHDLAMAMMGEELGLVSWDNRIVSRSVRHVACYEAEDLSDKEELPRQVMVVGADKVRTFRWSHKMRSNNKKIVKQIISNFKCLRVLDLSGCNIEEIPDSIGNLKLLRYLSLTDNRSIKALPFSMCKLLNLQVLRLVGCYRLEELPRDMGKLKNLRHLQLTIQSEYLFPKGMVGFVNSPSLRILELRNCNRLISLFPEEDEDEDEHDDDGDASSSSSAAAASASAAAAVGKINFLTQLRVLRLLDCPKLSSLLSNNMVYLTALKELVIFRCKSLDWRVELPSGPGLGSMKPNGLRSLESLSVCWIPKLVELPKGLEESALSLRYLYIGVCERLTSLPNWMKRCNLLGLELCNCPKLSTMPLELLTSLQKLHIGGCPPELSLGCDVSHIGDARIEDDD